MDSIVFERIYLVALVLETTTSIITIAKVQIIKLNVDGSIADKSSLPSCYDDGIIDLVSYKYIKNVCTPGSQCNRMETSLSPRAEVLIHQMCSSRDACISGKFPSWDLQILGVDAIQVEYECLDHFVTFLDLCTDTSKTVDATIHIRSSNTLETSKECTCSMTGGPFSVMLNDVRLSTGSGRTCSDAILQLPFHKYTCDNDSENLGSVFNSEVDALTSMYTIQLQTNSKKVLPQIIWMTIRTKKSLKVTCNSQPWKIELSVTTEPQTVAQADNATVATEAIMEDSVLETTVLIAAKLQLIKLNVNGSISDTTKLPTCQEGQSIDLVSYKYIENVCFSDGYCYRKEAFLSAKAELLIHEMCSLRVTCIPRSFPASDLKDIGVDTIEVRYFCLDHFVIFLDLCSDTTRTVDTTIYLRSSTTLETFKYCTCSVTGGPFSVAANDIRLLSRSGQGCAPAKLLLPPFQYVCESHSETFGSVFNKIVSNSTLNFTVQLQTNSKKVVPQMVWMTIQPKHSITVTCKGHPWNVEQTVTAEAITDDSGENTSEQKTLYAGIGAGIGVGVCILSVLLVWLVYLKRERRRISNNLVCELNPHQIELLPSTSGSKSGPDLSKPQAENNLRSDDNRKVKVNSTESPTRNEAAELIPVDSNFKQRTCMTESDRYPDILETNDMMMQMTMQFN